MKTNPSTNERGAILLTVLLTVTILTMLCFTSLYIASQNANATAQAASWQQALGGAESAVDQAIAALNTGTWTNWVTITGSLPNLQPQPSATPTAASGPPASNQYNYLSNSITPQLAQYNVANALTTSGEGSNLVSVWTTIDTAGLPLDSNGNQWFRIRATGTAAAAGPPRVSNQGLDSNLRKIGLRFDRKTSNAISSPQATRTIEVIVQGLAQSIWVRGVTLKSTITMSGGGLIDSFKSTDSSESTNGQYDASKLHTAPTNYGNHGDVATTSSGNSNLNNTYIYGNLAYSGSAVKNTNHVQGTISTPFNATIPSTSDPSWTSGMWNSSITQVTGTTTLTGGTQSSPAPYKLSQINLSGSSVLTLAANTDGTDTYIEIWVTGKMTTSGNAYITQGSKVHVTYWVDNDITLSGSSYLNQSSVASYLTINGVGSHNFTDSGNATLTAVINAPGFDITISGGGSVSGAVIANTLNLSGGSGLHYDEALNINGTSSAIGNYAFASWFEDTR
jgi:primosomal replication protein N/Tfp pilus assembly protein PilX